MELNISVTNDALIIPVGIATTPIPIREIIEAKTFPQTVIGTISPYPTVASETVAHQIDAVMLENTSGCASFSRKYIADAENRMVSKERNKVKYNSFLTDPSALMNSFNDLLLLPSLKILESLNKRRILKKRQSKRTNSLI